MVSQKFFKRWLPVFILLGLAAVSTPVLAAGTTSDPVIVAEDPVLYEDPTVEEFLETVDIENELLVIEGGTTKDEPTIDVYPYLRSGVESVGAGSGLPLAVTSGDWSFDIEGRARVDGRRPGATDWYVVTPGYFETLRIPIVGGRSLRASDTATAPIAAVFGDRRNAAWGSS